MVSIRVFNERDEGSLVVESDGEGLTFSVLDRQAEQYARVDPEDVEVFLSVLTELAGRYLLRDAE